MLDRKIGTGDREHLFSFPPLVKGGEGGFEVRYFAFKV